MLNNYVEMAIIDLDKSGKTDQALYSLYDYFYDEFEDENFESIDLSIAFYAQYIDTYSIDLALGILTASLPAKSKLLNRERYLELAIKKSKDIKEYTDNLFYGL